MPIYTLNSSSRTFRNIFKKKHEEKSYDMQKFTPNYSKHNCDVTSTYFHSMKLCNGEICPEYSRKNYVSEKLRLHNATLRNNLTNKTSETNASVENLLQKTKRLKQNILNSYIVTLPPC